MYISGSAGHKFVVPTNASYLRFDWKWADKDVVQIERGETATAYSPYKLNHHQIPEEVLEQYPLRSAGDVYDTITCEPTNVNGQLVWKKYHTKNTDVLNIGSLDYTQHSTDLSRFSATKPSSMKTVDNDTKMHQTSIYQSIKGNDMIADTDKAIRILNSSTMQIRDTAYTTVESFKTAMNGTLMVYELATPTRTDITDLFPEDWEVLKGLEAGGTLTFVNSHGDDYRIPVPSTENYEVSVQEVLTNG